MLRRTVVAGLSVALLVASGAATSAEATLSSQLADSGYAAAVSHPVEDSYYPAKGDPRLDALHYGLDLSWHPSTRLLDGVAVIRFRSPGATRQVRLDLGNPLEVRSVRLDGAAATYTHDGKDLTVHTGALARDSRHTLRISYLGTPKPVKAPSTRSDLTAVGWTTTRRGQVWTMQEPFGAFTWYPVNDQPSDKAFYDARISVPKGWVGVFNGRMVSRGVVGDRTITRFHLGSPAASYLTTIAIGPYRAVHDVGPHGLPLTYWVQGRATRDLRALQKTPKLLGWLESKLGSYPFARAGVVVVPGHSAMETQTLLTVSDSILFFPSYARDTLLHEFAHQWYGDTVTPRDWRDLWLSEGFAMYVQIRFEASHGGWSMDHWVRYLRHVDQKMRDRFGPPGDYHRLQFAQGSVYYCPALMLHELRRKLGARTFDRLLKAWPRQHELTNQSRHSYIRWLNHQTGRNLRPFIHTWLTSTTTPM